jgi:hypothetical protein
MYCQFCFASPMQDFVDEILGLVELHPQALSLVGLPGVFGLSVEQRKRLTIGACCCSPCPVHCNAATDAHV